MTICGIAAAIQSQTADSVTVMVGTGGVGRGDITVHSLGLGLTRFADGYTYNPPGCIFEPFGTWRSVSNLPAARRGLAAASANGKIYAVGGFAGDGYKSTVYEYDPLWPAQGWRSVSNLPAARGYLAAVSVTGKICAIGGCDAYNSCSTVYEYDPLQPGLGWLSVSNLPAGRQRLAATSVNTTIYAIGGISSSFTYESTVSEYRPLQPEQGWLSVSNLPVVLSSMAAASLNNKAYAIGGFNNSQIYQSSVYEYDPSHPEQGWMNAGNLPEGLSSMAAVSIIDKIYSMGGHNNSGTQSTVFGYDPAHPEQGWRMVCNLPEALSHMAVASMNGQAYIIGGWNNDAGFHSTVYEGSFLPGTLPSGSHPTGGDTIIIRGNSLGSGDVTNVTLCGIAATILADNSPTQIVVQAGAAAVGTNGDVVVRSTSYGTTVASNAYTYGVEISASAGTKGCIAPSGSIFVVPDGDTNFVITADSYYHIASILSNGQAVAFANPTNVTVAWSNITTDGTIRAEFAENLATNGVPEWWLHQYYPASNDFNAVALSDTDGDRLQAWAEHFAGTDPTNAASTLAISAVSNGFAISWWSVTGKYYTLSRSTNLQLGFDFNVKTSIPATPPTNTEADTNAPAIGPWFYRVRVE